jgi:glycosyltransferase involved in cell wall biosynthesis
MPNILIEAMSAGLPILSSNYEPMPEFLGKEHLFYFDPTSVESTYNGLKNFITSKQLATSAQDSYTKSLQYNWEDCAKETFAFLYQTLEKHIHATT